MSANPAVSSARASDALTRNQLLEMYYFARLARDIEERLVILFRQSKVIGGCTAALDRRASRSGRPTRSGGPTRSCRSSGTWRR